MGWPEKGFPGNQGPYYCSVGGNVCFGRAVSDMHMKACLYSGLKISGTNAEVMPGQWEYQIGPAIGIEAGDHMWMSRYFLQRVAEDQGLVISLEPKLFNDWNGSGCHTNFSTTTMRAGTGGMAYIEDMMEHMAKKHMIHQECYGEGNHKRMTGQHETSDFNKFTWGAGNRAASVRIPTQTIADNGKGYWEDRRPASNMDPYIVTGLIFDTTVIKKDMSAPMVSQYKGWLQWLSQITVEQP